MAEPPAKLARLDGVGDVTTVGAAAVLAMDTSSDEQMPKQRRSAGAGSKGSGKAGPSKNPLGRTHRGTGRGRGRSKGKGKAVYRPKPPARGALTADEVERALTQARPAVTTAADKASLVLEVDKDKGLRPTHTLPSYLGNIVKPHQLTGVRFIWHHLRQGHGCVLADYMGLGKTLQVLCTLYVFLSSFSPIDESLAGLGPQPPPDEDAAGSDGGTGADAAASGDTPDVGTGGSAEAPRARSKGSGAGSGGGLPAVATPPLASTNGRSGRGRGGPKCGRVLVLAPAIVVRNWQAESRKFFPVDALELLNPTVVDSALYKTIQSRVDAISAWHDRGGLLFVGYEQFRLLVQPSSTKRISEALLKKLRACLCDPGPDIIVLDEGHRVRDPKSLLFKALARVRTARRLVLTGYPLQNHLKEYYYMIEFCCPGVLGERWSFRAKFETPINAGSAKDSTPGEVKLAQQRTFVLSALLKPHVLRRDVRYLKAVLPPKHEWVIHCQLSAFQGRLYRSFLRARRDLDAAAKAMARDRQRGGLVEVRDGKLGGRKGQGDLLAAYHTSLMINNHPDILHEAMLHMEKNEVTPDDLENAQAEAAERRRVHEEEMDRVRQRQAREEREARRAQVIVPLIPVWAACVRQLVALAYQEAQVIVALGQRRGNASRDAERRLQLQREAAEVASVRALVRSAQKAVAAAAAVPAPRNASAHPPSVVSGAVAAPLSSSPTDVEAAAAAAVADAISSDAMAAPAPSPSSSTAAATLASAAACAGAASARAPAPALASSPADAEAAAAALATSTAALQDVLSRHEVARQAFEERANAAAAQVKASALEWLKTCHPRDFNRPVADPCVDWPLYRVAARAGGGKSLGMDVLSVSNVATVVTKIQPGSPLDVGRIAVGDVCIGCCAASSAFAGYPTPPQATATNGTATNATATNSAAGTGGGTGTGAGAAAGGSDGAAGHVAAGASPQTLACRAGNGAASATVVVGPTDLVWAPAPPMPAQLQAAMHDEVAGRERLRRSSTFLQQAVPGAGLPLPGTALFIQRLRHACAADSQGHVVFWFRRAPWSPLGTEAHGFGAGNLCYTKPSVAPASPPTPVAVDVATSSAVDASCVGGGGGSSGAGQAESKEAPAGGAVAAAPAGAADVDMAEDSDDILEIVDVDMGSSDAGRGGGGAGPGTGATSGHAGAGAGSAGGVATVSAASAAAGAGSGATGSPSAKATAAESDDDVVFCEEVETRVVTHRLSWAKSIFQGYRAARVEDSTKCRVFMQILKSCLDRKERLSVFSQSVVTLNVLERLISQFSRQREGKRQIGENGRVTKLGPVHVLRITGSTTQRTRHENIAKFNDPGADVDVMLVSTRAGGEGVNLVGGSRVVLFDVCWNPCHDHQAMCRSYRFGQTRPVSVYRLVGSGTMERTIYNQQIRKERLLRTVVDEYGVARHFTHKELNEFFDMKSFRKAQRRGRRGKKRKAADTAAAEGKTEKDDMLEGGKDDDANAPSRDMKAAMQDQVLLSVIRECGDVLEGWDEQDTLMTEDSNEMVLGDAAKKEAMNNYLLEQERTTYRPPLVGITGGSAGVGAGYAGHGRALPSGAAAGAPVVGAGVPFPYRPAPGEVGSQAPRFSGVPAAGAAGGASTGMASLSRMLHQAQARTAHMQQMQQYYQQAQQHNILRQQAADAASTGGAGPATVPSFARSYLTPSAPAPVSGPMASPFAASAQAARQPHPLPMAPRGAYDTQGQVRQDPRLALASPAYASARPVAFRVHRAAGPATPACIAGSPAAAAEGMYIAPQPPVRTLAELTRLYSGRGAGAGAGAAAGAGDGGQASTSGRNTYPIPLPAAPPLAASSSRVLQPLPGAMKSATLAAPEATELIDLVDSD